MRAYDLLYAAKYLISRYEVEYYGASLSLFLPPLTSHHVIIKTSQRAVLRERPPVFVLF